MSRPAGLLAVPFPSPSPVLVAMMDELRLAASLPAETPSEARRVAMLPRPWDPACCPAELRNFIYVWLENVAGWINTEHTWRVDQMLPACWMEHPHVVHELAVVACERWEASYALSPGALEAWQHYTLPTFLDRATLRVGNRCPPGRHQPHPGTARQELLADPAQATHRRARRRADEECGSSSS